MSRSAVKRGASVVGLAIVGYLLGASSVAFETFPYPQFLGPAFEALEARRAQMETISDPLGSNLWFPSRTDERGVTEHVSDRSWGEYTFYAAQTTEAKLIDSRGEVVHEWSLPFREAFDDPAHVDRSLPPELVFWRAQVFPDGDVIAIYTALGGTPYGQGLVRIDRDSEILWRLPQHMHHDFELQSDGSVWALSQDFRSMDDRPLDGFPQLPSTVLTDDAVHISPSGEEIGRVDLLEAFARSEYRSMIEMFDQRTKNPASGQTAWDVLHANAISRVGADFAEHHDFAEAGQLLLSFRGFDAIALIDPDDERVVWAARGFWWNQHDPDPLPNGNILVFDNHGHGGGGWGSRIVEFDPADNRIVWSYAGDADNHFWSRRRGTQQQLPNGNILITSTEEGRLFEVTRDGEIVWNFYNPVRRTDDDGTEFIGIVNSGRRYRAEQLPFLSE